MIASTGQRVVVSNIYVVLRHFLIVHRGDGGFRNFDHCCVRVLDQCSDSSLNTVFFIAVATLGNRAVGHVRLQDEAQAPLPTDAYAVLAK